MPGGAYRQFLTNARLIKVLTACSTTGGRCIMAKAELHQSRNSRSCPHHNVHDSFRDRSYRGRCSSLRSPSHHESSRPRRRDNRSRSPPRDRLINHLHILNRGVVCRLSCLGYPRDRLLCNQTEFVAGSVVHHSNDVRSQDITSAVLPPPVSQLLEPLSMGHVDWHCLQHW
jgi:hypothetical protein